MLKEADDVSVSAQAPLDRVRLRRAPPHGEHCPDCPQRAAEHPLRPPPETKPQGGDILTKSALLATQVANGLVGTPPNAATQTAGAKPLPTCVAQPGTLPTFPIPTPRSPNDPLPDLERTAVVSYIASGRSYADPTRTIDLAPQVDVRDKWMVIVGHADCRTERYYVSTESINSFDSTLPPGSVVVHVSQPSSMPHYAPPVTSSAPTKVYPPTPTATGSAAAPGTAKATSG